MWKWIMRDYFAAFRFQKIMKAGNGFWWFYALYMGIVLPAITLFKETGEYTVYLLICVPLLFCSLSSLLHPMRLPKVMHLCPLSEEVKKEYLIKSAIFRIMVTSLIGGVGIAILVLSGFCHVIMGAILLINVVIVSIALSGLQEKGKEKSKNEKMSNWNTSLCGETGREASNIVAITMISSFGIACLLCWDTPVYWWVKWIFAGVALLIQIPLTVKFLKTRNIAVERAISYERSYL